VPAAKSAVTLLLSSASGTRENSTVTWGFFSVYSGTCFSSTAFLVLLCSTWVTRTGFLVALSGPLVCGAPQAAAKMASDPAAGAPGWMTTARRENRRRSRSMGLSS
jgi:hypothetical protein